MGDSISVYWGDFLVNPIPLELSFNWCSHSCHYCFANLNKPDRKADIKKTLNLLANYRDRTTLEARFLQWGYPILISNRVDPFASSNYAQAVPVIDLLTQMGIPITYQTKGGKGIDEVLAFAEPACWYISIATDNDDLRAKIEPGATSINDRLQLIEKLTNRNHSVVVGINPLVPEWLPKPRQLLEEIESRGAKGVWIELLHLNTNQIKNIPSKGVNALTQGLIERVKGRYYNQKDLDHFKRTETLILEETRLELFSSCHLGYSNFWNIYRKHYEITLPTMQDFINACYKEGMGEGDLIDFDMFADFFCGVLPKGKQYIGNYLASADRNIYRGLPKGTWDNWLTYRDLLKQIWMRPKLRLSPFHSTAFGLAARMEGDGLKQVVDEFGLPYGVFCPRGTDNYLVEV